MKEGSRRLLWRPLFITLIGALYCFWITLGNELTFCFTSGCALYGDMTFAGLSLWYFGMAAFIAMSMLAVFGLETVGTLLSGAALLADIGLLALMAATAPCISCLGVAVFFALTYASFRYAAPAHDMESKSRTHRGISLLLCAWALLWVIDASYVIRGELDPWAIPNDTENADIHIYFSPSCPACKKAVQAYSGNISAVFHPVAEKDIDISAVMHMLKARAEGASVKDALSEALLDAKPLQFSDSLSPDVLLLRFRMLLNKAHIFNAGVRSVPYIEYRGLPSHVAEQVNSRELNRLRDEAKEALDGVGARPKYTPRDGSGVPAERSILEPDEGIAGRCGESSVPCPD